MLTCEIESQITARDCQSKPKESERIYTLLARILRARTAEPEDLDQANVL